MGSPPVTVRTSGSKEQGDRKFCTVYLVTNGISIILTVPTFYSTCRLCLQNLTLLTDAVLLDYVFLTLAHFQSILHSEAMLFSKPVTHSFKILDGFPFSLTKPRLLNPASRVLHNMPFSHLLNLSSHYPLPPSSSEPLHLFCY